MRVIGIDVGYTGAIACIASDGEYEIYDMPTYKKQAGKQTKIILDKRALTNLIFNVAVTPGLVTVFIEKQQTMPNQGVVSAFNLGAQEGFIKGLLYGMSLPYQTVPPKKWQAEFSIVKAKSTKGASYERASALFPKAVLKTQRGRLLDGRSDSILIGEYGRRKLRI